MKVGGKLFPAPTQLLPENGCGVQAETVLDSLVATLKGCLPNPCDKVITTSETWLHREFRQATRNLLVSVASSLGQVLPGEWKMSHCIPPNSLMPCGNHQRHELLPAEIAILSEGQCTNRKLFFLWSESDGVIQQHLDFYPDPRSFFRLTFSGDEGTEVP